MSADNYICIQPVVNTKWVAQMGFLSDDTYPDPTKARPEDYYDSLDEAIRANQIRADKAEYGFKVVTTPYATGHEGTYADEETLTKVYAAFIKNGVDRQVAFDVVSEMQNSGLLFRERDPDKALAEEFDPIDVTPEGGEPSA